MPVFEPNGPRRFAHQMRGLRDIIRNRGVHALLFDPGTGKTAVALDYMSLLALKLPEGEARVLVVCPLAAIDTWVGQAMTYVHADVNVWAEALGGSVRQKAEAIAARNGRPLPRTPVEVRAAPRAVGYRRSTSLMTRPHIRASQGPAVLDSPRLILLVLNLDALSSRHKVKGYASKTNDDMLIDAITRFNPHLVVVDESQRIKGAGSKVSGAMARIGRLVPRRLILTGTVIPHSPMDVYGQWRFLDPYAFGRTAKGGGRLAATKASFENRYAILGGHMGKQIVGFRNLDEMQAIMALRSTVARKADVLDLPPVTEVIVPVRLSPAEAKAYAEMKKGLRTSFASPDGTEQRVVAKTKLTQAMRLRQITSGFSTDTAGGTVRLGTSKAATIASLVNDTLNSEQRVVVFCHFRHEIDVLVPLLSRSDTDVLTITGDTHAHERDVTRRRFGSDDPRRIVMVAQVRTMSVAVNELVSASHAIFGSLSLQRDDYEQAVARLDRQGQTKPVTIWVTQVGGSVDEAIFKSIKDRTNLEDAVLAHIMDDPDNPNDDDRD